MRFIGVIAYSGQEHLGPQKMPLGVCYAGNAVVQCPQTLATSNDHLRTALTFTQADCNCNLFTGLFGIFSNMGVVFSLKSLISTAHSAQPNRHGKIRPKFTTWGRGGEGGRGGLHNFQKIYIFTFWVSWTKAAREGAPNWRKWWILIMAKITLMVKGRLTNATTWGHIKNTQWRKVKQMQPVWLYIFWDRQLEGTF